MDRDINEQTHASSDRGLCVKGCGFFGNQSFDGMCSMCHKDFQRRQEEKTKLAAEGRLNCTGSSSSPVLPKLLSPRACTSSLSSTTEAFSSTETSPVTIEKVEVRAQAFDKAVSPLSSGEATPLSSEEATPSKPKKARCHVGSCRARLGLMGKFMSSSGSSTTSYFADVSGVF